MSDPFGFLITNVILKWKKIIRIFFTTTSWSIYVGTDASNHVLGVFGKLLTRRGAWAWFHDIWTCSAKVLEYWMISSLKIKLNRSWKFRRNWNVPLVLLERSWWAGSTNTHVMTSLFFQFEILYKCEKNMKREYLI
jgi:hypothetical protein